MALAPIGGGMADMAARVASIQARIGSVSGVASAPGGSAFSLDGAGQVRSARATPGIGDAVVSPASTQAAAVETTPPVLAEAAVEAAEDPEASEAASAEADGAEAAPEAEESGDSAEAAETDEVSEEAEAAEEQEASEAAPTDEADDPEPDDASAEADESAPAAESNAAEDAPAPEATPAATTDAAATEPPATESRLAEVLPEAGQPWAALIESVAEEVGIDPALLAALVRHESNFNPDARSHAGAIGLTQLMPGTAAGLGVDPTDPQQNLEGGATYLRQQLDRFGDVALALAAYNAGPGRVVEAGGVPRIPETMNFVDRVIDTWEALR